MSVSNAISSVVGAVMLVGVLYVVTTTVERQQQDVEQMVFGRELPSYNHMQELKQYIVAAKATVQKLKTDNNMKEARQVSDVCRQLVETYRIEQNFALNHGMYQRTHSQPIYDDGCE